MLLAEALAERADAQKRLVELRSRLERNAKVQDGDAPDEDPHALLAEYDRTCDTLQALIQAINRTNAATPFDWSRTLSDALAERDVLALRRKSLASVIESAAERMQRYSLSEIKLVATVDVRAVQQRADALAKAFRDLDTRIQQLNWQVELRE